MVMGQPVLESERPAFRAVIKVTLLNNELAGKSITLQGVFVGGSAGNAEGKLMQVRRIMGKGADGHLLSGLFLLSEANLLELNALLKDLDFCSSLAQNSFITSRPW